jgi:flagellar biosynthesis/type III secretory pathway chaperone
MELKKLIESIDVQAKLLNELLQVLDRETVEMGNVNIPAMAISNRSKEELAAKISEHSPLLQKAIAAFATQEGLPETTLLSALAEHVAKRGDKELLKKQKQIRETAISVQLVATLNREIAEHFASSAATTLSLITRLINQSNVYGASGTYQQRPTGAVMINREA